MPIVQSDGFVSIKELIIPGLPGSLFRKQSLATHVNRSWRERRRERERERERDDKITHGLKF